MTNVIVYTAPNCQPCKAVKRWLDQNGVEYREERANDWVDKLGDMGYRSAPVTVKGELHFGGFDIAKLQLLAG